MPFCRCHAGIGPLWPIVVLVASAVGFCDDGASPRAAYHSIQSLEEGVTLATHRSGLTVIVQENHTAPVATVRCYVKNTGSVYEGRYLGAGISHLLEHLVSGGTTKNRSEKEIEKIIDRFGGGANAYTTTHLTAYFIDCPAKDTPTAIELIADAMRHVVFEQEEFDREYEVVQRELADGEVDRGRVLYNTLRQTMYTASPFRHPVIGYLDALRGLTRDDIVAFYRERYVPNNMVFVVVGDVQTDAALGEIAKQFADARRGLETPVTLADEPRVLSPRQAIREMDGETVDFALAWPSVELSHPDLYALDVAAYILTEGESSRLARRLKYEEPLALGVESASYTPHFVPGMFLIQAATTPEKYEAARRAILEEIARLKKEPVDEKELAKAKKQKAAELVFGRETVQELADSLGSGFISTGDPLFDRAYVEGIEEVTAEDVLGVARRYFDDTRLVQVAITPPGKPSAVAKENRTSKERAIKAVKLKNGVTLLLKHSSHAPLVNMQAYVLAGNLVDTPETAGRTQLVAEMLDKGTGEMSAREIAEFFDSRGGKFSASAGRFTVFASATMLKEDWAEAFEIFAKCVIEPALPADEFAKVKERAIAAVAARKANPQAEITEWFFASLPESTPYHTLTGGTDASLKALTSEDIVAYHRDYFAPQNMVVTVFGDFDEQTALYKARKFFGGLKTPADYQTPDWNRSNAISRNTARHHKTAKPTGMVMLGYPVMSVREPKEWAALTVLDAVMSGYSYPGGWLHRELRSEGLVYFVHAFPIGGPAPGYLGILAQTRPDAIDEVVERIEKNIARARRGEITQEEFETAVNMVKALHAQENTTLAAQARTAALDELYGLGYANDEGFDARIDALELDDVKTVARKYFGKRVLVTSGP